MNKLTTFLMQSELFSSIPLPDLEELSTRLQVRLAWKDEVVANEGDPCVSLGLILSGQLASVKYARSGSFVTVDLMEAGAVVGEDLLFSSRPVYPLTIEAVTNARVVYIPQNLLLQLMDRYPGMSKKLVSLLSDQALAQNSRLVTLAQRSLRAKIAVYLLNLLEADRLQDEAAGPKNHKSRISTPSVELPVSKEMTARLLGIPRPSFSRELVRMNKDGLIRVSGRVIWLLDVGGLEGEGDEEDDSEWGGD